MAKLPGMATPWVSTALSNQPQVRADLLGRSPHTEGWLYANIDAGTSIAAALGRQRDFAHRRNRIPARFLLVRPDGLPSPSTHRHGNESDRRTPGAGTPNSHRRRHQRLRSWFARARQ